MAEKRKTKKYNGVTLSYTDVEYKWIDEYNFRRRKAVLTEDFYCRISFEGSDGKPATGNLDHCVIIPAGYKTDFASIPLLAQVLIGDNVEFAEESIVHDWLCDNHAPRFFANGIMRILMEALGRPRWKVLGVYYALMIAGYGSPVYDFFTKKFSRKK